MAYPAFNPSKHARGFHGRFASGGGAAAQRYRLGGLARVRTDRGEILEQRAVGNRSVSAFQPPASASARRARKDAIRAAVEVPRGVRRPRNWKEQQQLEWASPRKILEQRALTGNALMPRKEAVKRAAHMARLEPGRRKPRVGVKTTFTGKRRVVSGYSVVPGVRPTGVARRFAGRD